MKWTNSCDALVDFVEEHGGSMGGETRAHLFNIVQNIIDGQVVGCNLDGDGYCSTHASWRCFPNLGEVAGVKTSPSPAPSVGELPDTETLLAETPAEAVFCDHSQWRECAATLEMVRDLSDKALNYTAAYDLANDLAAILAGYDDAIPGASVEPVPAPHLEHVLELRDDGWSLEHPQVCRESKSLLDCPVHSVVKSHEDEMELWEHGRFNVGLDEYGELEKLSSAPPVGERE